MTAKGMLNNYIVNPFKKRLAERFGVSVDNVDVSISTMTTREFLAMHGIDTTKNSVIYNYLKALYEHAFFHSPYSNQNYYIVGQNAKLVKEKPYEDIAKKGQKTIKTTKKAIGVAKYFKPQVAVLNLPLDVADLVLEVVKDIERKKVNANITIYKESLTDVLYDFVEVYGKANGIDNPYETAIEQMITFFKKPTTLPAYLKKKHSDNQLEWATQQVFRKLLAFEDKERAKALYTLYKYYTQHSDKDKDMPLADFYEKFYQATMWDMWNEISYAYEQQGIFLNEEQKEKFFNRMQKKFYKDWLRDVYLYGTENDKIHVAHRVMVGQGMGVYGKNGGNETLKEFIASATFLNEIMEEADFTLEEREELIPKILTYSHIMGGSSYYLGNRNPAQEYEKVMRNPRDTFFEYFLRSHLASKLVVKYAVKGHFNENGEGVIDDVNHLSSITSHVGENNEPYYMGDWIMYEMDKLLPTDVFTNEIIHKKWDMWQKERFEHNMRQIISEAGYQLEKTRINDKATAKWSPFVRRYLKTVSQDSITDEILKQAQQDLSAHHKSMLQTLRTDTKYRHFFTDLTVSHEIYKAIDTIQKELDPETRTNNSNKEISFETPVEMPDAKRNIEISFKRLDETLSNWKSEIVIFKKHRQNEIYLPFHKTTTYMPISEYLHNQLVIPLDEPYNKDELHPDAYSLIVLNDPKLKSLWENIKDKYISKGRGRH